MQRYCQMKWNWSSRVYFEYSLEMNCIGFRPIRTFARKLTRIRAQRLVGLMMMGIVILAFRMVGLKRLMFVILLILVRYLEL